MTTYAIIQMKRKAFGKEVYMATSSITDRFVLDDKGVDRLIEIIENSKAHPNKKVYESHKYEEGKKLLKQYFSR